MVSCLGIKLNINIKIYLLLLICCNIIFLPSKVFSIWVESTPLPVAKSGTSAAILNNEIIVVGGKGIVGNNPLSEIFDIDGKIWRPISLFPKDFHGFRIISFQNKILLCGGYNKNKPTKNCWIYDHSLSNWAQISDMPYARADHVMVKINNKVFFIGGVGESPEKVMSYNLNYGKWSTSYAIFDDPLYASGFGVYNENIAIIGGIEVSNSEISNRFEIFDPKLNKWKKNINYPLSIASSSVQQIKNNLHVSGGKTLNPNRTYKEHYSFEKDNWVKKEAMPTPRHSMSSVFINENWYLIGGSISPGFFSLFSPTDVVEIYIDK